MSGFNNKFGNQSKPAARTNYADKNRTEGTVSEKVILGGLYEHTSKDGSASKLVMKGKISRDITIPAGYELKVFVQGGKSKNGKDLPPYQLIAQPARTRNV